MSIVLAHLEVVCLFLHRNICVCSTPNKDVTISHLMVLAVLRVVPSLALEE